MEPTTYDGTPRATLRQGEELGLASTGCASPPEALPLVAGSQALGREAEV